MWFCALLKTSTPGAIVEPERDQGLNHLLQVSWCNPLLKVELAARLQQLAQDFIHTNFEYPYDEDPPPPWAACLCAQILLWGRLISLCPAGVSLAASCVLCSGSCHFALRSGFFFPVTVIYWKTTTRSYLPFLLQVEQTHFS